MEELQRNVATSEEDADFEHDDELDTNMMGENMDAYMANSQLLDGVAAIQARKNQQGIGMEDEDMDGADAGDDDLQEAGELSAGDPDAEGESDRELDDQALGAHTDDGIEDEDAEGEDEDASGDDDDEEEDDNVEGVGAVKIQPGFLEEDDEDVPSPQDDDDSDATTVHASDESSDAESEVEAEWATAAGEEEEDLPKNENPNSCIFCQQDETHDPSEDFEEYLACAVCGDNAHQQCARDANRLNEDQETKTWCCPDCVGNALAPDATMPAGGDTIAALLEKGSSVPKLARDLLPPQRGTIKPNSHSVFNNLIVDDDPMDGSRVLRKRKNSSAEAEELKSFRKRRAFGSSGSLHAVTSVGAGDKKDEILSVEEEVEGEVDVVKPRESRTLRQKSVPQTNSVTTIGRASILKSSRTSIIITFHLEPAALRHITSKPVKPKKRSRIAVRAPPVAITHTIHAHHGAQPFYSLLDKETDESKAKPYGGILSEEQADTSKCLPVTDDRRQFDEGCQKAEIEWEEKVRAQQAEAEASLAKREVTRKPRKVSGPASQIECINFGGSEIDTWYAAPYPEEYSRNRVLYICEFCLKYMSSDYVAWRHKMKCRAKHPPGDEIYREKSVSMFEVDGRKNPVYCQNLCLLAKLFLGSKTLYYDVEPFLFYVMTETDKYGCHFVGYFSKEKRPSSQNNVSCIMTLPIHQRKGYGNLLIDFSYLLTRVEEKIGSPEKPLSDMGLVSYRNYWRLVLCYTLKLHHGTPFSVAEMCKATGMTADDVVSGLDGLHAIVRDPITHAYALRLDLSYFEKYISDWENKKYVRLNDKALNWTPFVMGRQHASMVEHQPLSTIAPREEEEQVAPDQKLQPQLVQPTTEETLVNGDVAFSSNESVREGLHIENGTATNGPVSDEAIKDDMAIDTSAVAPVEPATPDKAHRKAKEILNAQKDDNPQRSPLPRRPSQQSPRPSTNGYGHSPLLVPAAATDMETIATIEALSTTQHQPTVNGVPAHILSIPASRFEIYPPALPSRRVARPSIATGATPTTTTRSRPSASTVRRRRRSGAAIGGSSRRPSARPRTSSSRRRTGGTGRGPGRWPKGTKKSDFGNADSGPGLPPKLRRRFVVDDDEEDELALNGTAGLDEHALEAMADAKEEDDEDEEIDEDAILYETPGRKRRGDTNPSSRRSISGKSHAKPTSGDEDAEGEEVDDEDFLVTGDIDIEGEDEDEDEDEEEDE